MVLSFLWSKFWMDFLNLCVEIQCATIVWLKLSRASIHKNRHPVSALDTWSPCPAGCPWATRVSSVPKLRARPRVVRRGHEFWGWRAYSGKVGKKSTTYSFSQPTLSLNSHLSLRWWKVLKWYKETYKRYGNKLGRLLCQDIDVELPVHWNRISRILYQVRRRMWSSLQLSTLLLLVTLVHVLFTLIDARAHNY